MPLRIAFVSVLIFLNTLALSSEQKLGEVSGQFGSSKFTLELLQSAGNTVGAAPTLQLKISDSTLSLSTGGLSEYEILKPTEPIRLTEIQLDPDTTAWLLHVSLIEQNVQQITIRERTIAAVLLKDALNWRILNEWTANRTALAEGGTLRQSLSITTPKTGTIQRQLRSLRVENIPFKLECGCGACASKTMEFLENETWVWNAERKTLSRTLFEKSYVLQPSEGLLSVARKALGDARLMSKLFKLNPGLNTESILKEGQAIVVERLLSS